MIRRAILFFGLFVVLGPLPLIGGAIWTWMDWSEHRQRVHEVEEHQRAGWIETDVIITSCLAVDRNAQTGESTYRWEGHWTDKNGKVHPSKGGSATCSTGVGHSLLYNPVNPEEYTLGAGRFIPVPLVLCFLGIGFTYIAIKSWRQARRDDAKEKPTQP